MVMQSEDIIRIMKKTNGDKKKTKEQLGVSNQAIHQRLKKDGYWFVWGWRKPGGDIAFLQK